MSPDAQARPAHASAKPGDARTSTTNGKPKGGSFGGAKGKRDTAAPEVEGRIEKKSVVVYSAPGVKVVKDSVVSYPQAIVKSVEYVVTFDGHPPVKEPRMGAAIERAKAGPPAVAVTETASVVPEGTSTEE